MIMSLRSTAAGKIQHSLSAGSIVAPGQLLSTLKLKDPSSVQTVQSFSGPYPLNRPVRAKSDSSVPGAAVTSLESTLTSHLNGYAISMNNVSTSGTSLVQALFTTEPFDFQQMIVSS